MELAEIFRFVSKTLGPLCCVEIATKYEGNRFQSLDQYRGEKIAHMGALYAPCVAPAHSPIRNYLQFDIDASDFPRRSCVPQHSEKEVCGHCWPLVVCAADVIMHLMREDFGAHDDPLLTVTGGRGVHLRYFGDEWITAHPLIRTAIADYLIREGRSMRVAQYILSHGYWKKLCDHQQWIPTTFYEDDEDNSWDYYIRLYPQRVFETISEFAGLRIDRNVTIGLNHLLRMPFSVHPRTGKRCLPVTFEQLKDFMEHPTTIDDGIQVLRNLIQ